jgi:prepilin-type N-terminal cleavage/methylation domain-containing protein
VRKSRRGYTLLEITLVLALICVLAALAAPSFEGMYGHVQVKAAADAFRTAMTEARSHAIDEGIPYSVAIVPGKGNYRVAPDSPSYWGGAGDSGSGFANDEVLPGNICFPLENGSHGDGTSLPVGSVDPGQWSKVATFYPDGTARDDHTVTFQSSGGGRPQVLTLRALTGGVTVSSGD